MRSPIEELKPTLVWKHFYQIGQIPRCSGNEQAIARHITGFADKLGYTWKMDKTGNVIVKKPASKGMEYRPAVVIQGHLDMVCEKNKETVHDFSKDPIRMLIKDGWITADGTTLGADNGIAVAMALAIMEDTAIAHPPMEFLFTVDEETGLTGANQLTDNFVDGRILLNIDSEEEGALYIGCAGGKHTILRKKIAWVDRHDDYKTFVLKVEGLRGGHSGLSIHEGFGNAIKLLSRVLINFKDEFHYHVAHIEGGNKHNAIPREAEAVIDVPAASMEKLHKFIDYFNATFKDELKFVDKEVRVKLEEHPAPEKVFATDFRDQLLGVLYAIPHGVVSMSHAIPGLVETSTNMAIIKTEGDKLEMLTSQRSSVASAIIDIADKVKALGELGGFEVEQGGGYPAWQPNPASKLLATCKEIFKNKYGKEPAVKAIHAGLECGIIGDHYPGMDMISLGPDLVAVHSPDEKINIQSAANVWDYLLDILKNIK